MVTCRHCQACLDLGALTQEQFKDYVEICFLRRAIKDERVLEGFENTICGFEKDLTEAGFEME